MQNVQTCILCSFLLLLSPSCVTQKEKAIQNNDTSASYAIMNFDCNKPIIMTIFVHGSILTRFAPRAFMRTIKDCALNKHNTRSIKEHYFEQLRRETFHLRQPINTCGLIPVPVDMSTKNPYRLTTLFSQLYHRVSSMVEPDSNINRLYYTFGWDGRVSQANRLREAHKLYKAIQQEHAHLQQQTKQPITIHVLTHSHGGNVALYLAQAQKTYKQNLHIDKLVMWGCPIQSETEPFIASDIFGHVYHCYSKGDHMQIADTFSTRDFFSRREVGTNKKQPVILPKNLTQIETTVGRNKPFHYELWLFGYKRAPHILYRKRLRTHPLPLALFSPAIMHLVDNSPHTPLHTKLSIENTGDMCTLCLHNNSYKNNIPISLELADLKKKTLENL